MKSVISLFLPLFLTLNSCIDPSTRNPASDTDNTTDTDGNLDTEKDNCPIADKKIVVETLDWTDVYFKDYVTTGTNVVAYNFRTTSLETYDGHFSFAALPESNNYMRRTWFSKCAGGPPLDQTYTYGAGKKFNPCDTRGIEHALIWTQSANATHSVCKLNKNKNYYLNMQQTQGSMPNPPKKYSQLIIAGYSSYRTPATIIDKCGPNGDKPFFETLDWTNLHYQKSITTGTGTVSSKFTTDHGYNYYGAFKARGTAESKNYTRKIWFSLCPGGPPIEDYYETGGKVLNACLRMGDDIELKWSNAYEERNYSFNSFDFPDHPRLPSECKLLKGTTYYLNYRQIKNENSTAPTENSQLIINSTSYGRPDTY